MKPLAYYQTNIGKYSLLPDLKQEILSLDYQTVFKTSHIRKHESTTIYPYGFDYLELICDTIHAALFIKMFEIVQQLEMQTTISATENQEISIIIY